VAAAVLVHVAGLPDSDYVDLPGVPRHSQVLLASTCNSSADTPVILST
jgi:hypothetical protein